jgi:hypothetical protein
MNQKEAEGTLRNLSKKPLFEYVLNVAVLADSYEDAMALVSQNLDQKSQGIIFHEFQDGIEVNGEEKIWFLRKSGLGRFIRI